jgi:hypothetical protein
VKTSSHKATLKLLPEVESETASSKRPNLAIDPGEMLYGSGKADLNALTLRVYCTASLIHNLTDSLSERQRQPAEIIQSKCPKHGPMVKTASVNYIQHPISLHSKEQTFQGKRKARLLQELRGINGI